MDLKVYIFHILHIYIKLHICIKLHIYITNLMLDGGTNIDIKSVCFVKSSGENKYFDEFDVTHVKNTIKYFEGKILLKLHFEVLYRRPTGIVCNEYCILFQ